MSRSKKKHAGFWTCVVQAGAMKKWKRCNHKSQRQKCFQYLKNIEKDDYYLDTYVSSSPKHEYSDIWCSPSDGRSYGLFSEREENWYKRILRK